MMNGYLISQGGGRCCLCIWE